MATAGNIDAGDKRREEPKNERGRGQPSRWRRNLVLLVLIVAGAWLGWAWQGLREKALVGASYGARIGCVCRVVSQRSLASCQGDIDVAGLTGVAGMVTLSEDIDQGTISASVPLLARQTASYRDGRGCLLEPWQD